MYDSVFRTMIHNLKPYVPALVNEAFGEHYTEKEIVTLKAGKEVQSIMGGYITEEFKVARLSVSIEKRWMEK